MNSTYRVLFNVVVEASSHEEAVRVAIATVKPSIGTFADIWTSELSDEDGEPISESMFSGETLREM